MPIYKFDITDVEGIENYGKFEITLAFHTKPSTNVEIAIKDTNAVDTWEHGTVTYNIAFGTGNTTPFKNETAVLYTQQMQLQK